MNVWPRIYFLKTLLALLRYLAQYVWEVLYGKLPGESKCTGCVTQMDLQRVPPFWKSYGQGAPKSELRSQPTGKDIASSSGTGRRFSKTPDFSRSIPDRSGRHLTCRLMLTMMGCLLWVSPLRYTLTSGRAHAFVLQWAKHLAPSICLHRRLSTAQVQGLSQRSSFGFKYDWTNIFYLLSTLTSASTWGKSRKECKYHPQMQY